MAWDGYFDKTNKSSVFWHNIRENKDLYTKKEDENFCKQWEEEYKKYFKVKGS